MHRLYGALPWQRVVAPGEAYASTGFPVSQALAVRLAAAQNVVRLDAALSAEFLDETGAVARRRAPRRTISRWAEPWARSASSGAGWFLSWRCGGTHLVAYSAAQGGGISEPNWPPPPRSKARRAARGRHSPTFPAHARRGRLLGFDHGQSFAAPGGPEADSVSQTLAAFGISRPAARHWVRQASPRWTLMAAPPPAR